MHESINTVNIKYEETKRNLLRTNKVTQYLYFRKNGEKLHSIIGTKDRDKTIKANRDQVTKYKQLHPRVCTNDSRDTSVTLPGWTELVIKDGKIIAFRELAPDGAGKYELEYFKLKRSIDF